MDSTFKQYKKNEIIYHMEDIPQAIGIVKEGSVVIETVDFFRQRFPIITYWSQSNVCGKLCPNQNTYVCIC